MAKPQPTAEYIAALSGSLETHWQKQAEVDDEALAVISQEHEIDVPKPKIPNFKPIIYRAGTAQDALDRYCGLIDKFIYKVERGWGAKAEMRAEKAEAFFQHFFWDYEAREGPIYGELKEDTLAVGRGWWEIIPWPAAWTTAAGQPVKGTGKDEEGEDVPKNETDEAHKKRVKAWKERIAKPPILVTYMPASTVRTVLSRNKVTEYVQEVEMLLGDAINQWPDGLQDWEAEDAKKKATQKVTVLKYGNDTWVSVVIKRTGGLLGKSTELKEVSHFAHGMGVAPIAMFEGFKFVKREPGLRWRSIVWKASLPS